MAWQSALLRRLGAPVTRQNIAFLNTWWRFEGGHVLNDAKFNWLNTTMGSQYPAINRVGVRRYPSMQIGIELTARTLSQPYARPIVQALRSGDPRRADRPALERALNTWQTGSGASGYGSQVISSYLSGSTSPPRGGRTTGRGRRPQSLPADDVPLPDQSQTARGTLFLPRFVSAGSVVSLDPSFVVAKPGGVTTLQPARASADVARPAPYRGTKANPAIDVDVPSHKPLTERAAQVVMLARKYLGTPYRWGGASPRTGFDCSGFVQWLYSSVGVQLPRTTWQQMRVGKPVAREDLRPGDIVFFGNGGHEGLYIGDGLFIHASRTGDVVKISSLDDPWYRQRFLTARRVLPGSTVSETTRQAA